MESPMVKARSGPNWASIGLAHEALVGDALSLLDRSAPCRSRRHRVLEYPAGLRRELVFDRIAGR
ncbi:hypothetical protein IU450_25895 [Nocardia abscessus]|uniref:hypothetical protein n=1 Tax=Nocardia abscessus TaxID=120957 RepID=UPI001895047F|nr:hypothetical protein [Nocardia abscessus]MBF6339300.1 hypothetical protein [Nocardia abscessus]